MHTALRCSLAINAIQRDVWGLQYNLNKSSSHQSTQTKLKLLSLLIGWMPCTQIHQPWQQVLKLNVWKSLKLCNLQALYVCILLLWKPFAASSKSIKNSGLISLPTCITSISCSCSWFVEYICCSACSNSWFLSRRVFPSAAAKWRSVKMQGNM